MTSAAPRASASHAARLARGDDDVAAGVLAGHEIFALEGQKGGLDAGRAAEPVPVVDGVPDGYRRPVHPDLVLVRCHSPPRGVTAPA